MKSRMLACFLCAVPLGSAFAQFPQPPSPNAQPAAQPNAFTVESPEQRAERETRADCTTDLAPIAAAYAESQRTKIFIDPRALRVSVCGTPLELPPTESEFRAILRLNSLTLVEVDSILNVIPVAVARSYPVPIVDEDDKDIPDDQYVTRVITVEGNSANNYIALLRPLLPQWDHLAPLQSLDPDATESKIVIAGTYGNVRRITQIIRDLTK